MPFWIEGWIEVCRSPDCDAANVWLGVIDIGPLIDSADVVSEQLFGLSKSFVNGTAHAEPLAANRGLPSNPSALVRQAIARIQAQESKSGTGEFGGYTHATWAEIRRHSLSAADLNQSDWYMVFDLVKYLEQYVAADRIRFVLWFNW